MRHIVITSIVLLLFSCSEPSSTTIVLENKQLNSEFSITITEPEKALLSWYLYAYGNECDESSNKLKCTVLDLLNISDECDPVHLNNLLQWFSADMMAVYKLNKCPNLPIKSAIQNKFEKIILVRKSDIITIEYKVLGLNTLQEKSWNIDRIDSFRLIDKTLVKISDNE